MHDVWRNFRGNLRDFLGEFFIEECLEHFPEDSLENSLKVAWQKFQKDILGKSPDKASENVINLLYLRMNCWRDPWNNLWSNI